MLSTQDSKTMIMAASQTAAEERKELKQDTTVDDIEMFTKSITKRGVVGLQNIGNTCYMNSALQILSNTTLLREYIIYNQSKSKQHDDEMDEVMGIFKDDLEENIKNRLAEEKRKKNNLAKDADVELFLDDINNSIQMSVSYNIRQVLKKMWSEKQVVWNPRILKDTIGRLNDTFRGFNQNDSQELLSYIIDKVHEETKRNEKIVIKKKMLSPQLLEYFDKTTKYNEAVKKAATPEEKQTLKVDYKNYYLQNIREMVIYRYLMFLQKYKSKNRSVISELITGSFCTETRCTECKNVSVVFDPYNILSLALPETSGREELTLEKCLDNFVVEELMSGENKYRCGECNKKVDAIRKTYIWDTPDYLFIQLKRFVNNGSRMMKNSEFVKYPMKDLSLQSTHSPYYPRDKTYELYGVIQHVGALGGGHYYAFAKNSINNKWYEFNDESVEYIPDEDITKRMINSNSYILAYKKTGLEN